MTISKEKLHTLLMMLIWLLLLILLVSIGILAWVPPVSRDALVHHLAVPKLWLKHGGIYEIPDLVFSYYPMNLDLLYMVPLYFGNDIIPKYIHFAFALATSWLIFGYLKNRMGRLYAALGILLFLSTPAIVKLSITAYVDLGMIFFSTAGLLFALRWHEDFPRIKYLFMAALFCGLAMGTKYNGLMIFFLLTLLVVFIVTRRVADQKQVILRAGFYSIIFMLTAGLIYSPWGIRNYSWTGNPFYPLFDNWFNSGGSSELQALPPFVLRKLLYHESLWEILMVPFRIFFEGLDDSPRYFDGKLNPALLVLPFFAFAASDRDRDTLRPVFEKGAMAAFSILLVLLVFFTTSMRIRYVAPAIPCLVILSIFGVKNIFAFIDERFAGYLRKIFVGILFIAMLLPFYLNAVYVMQQFRIVTPFEYLNSDISRDHYIEKFRPEYAVIRHANDFLPPDAKILSLFIGNRGYYSDRQMVFDIDLFRSLIQTSGSAEALSAKLKDHGLTHVLIRFDMFDNWCHNNLNSIEKQIVVDFLTAKNLRMHVQNGHGLYQLE